MKENNLMPGNYFLNPDNKIETVYDNYFDTDEGVRFINDWNILVIKPVPLTEEWLLKFGFETSEDYSGSWLSPADDYGSQKRILSAVNKEMFLWQYSDYNNVKIKYIHQLQNLYFVLTQKELTIL